MPVSAIITQAARRIDEDARPAIGGNGNEEACA